MRIIIGDTKVSEFSKQELDFASFKKIKNLKIIRKI